MGFRFLPNMRMMRIDAHPMRIGRCIRMANPNLLLETWHLLCSQCASLPWKKEFQFDANLTAETF